MNKTFILIALSFLIINNLIAQKDSKSGLKLTEYNSTLNEKIYRILISDHQIVELIASKNGEYNGSLINCIWKINKKHEDKLITQKIKIQNLTVKKLMTELNDTDFESLPDCKDLKDCIIGDDGTTISFYVFKKGLSRNYSYWEPESDYYYKGKTIPEVLQVRKILKFVNNEFNLRDNFSKFKNKLPPGEYTYGMIIFEIKNN